MKTMQFRVLGPVELAAEGRRVSLSSDRQRAVLAALLAHPGETLSPDRLVDAVWGDRPPASAHQSLHSHISRLRGVLATAASHGAEALITEEAGYRVDLDVHELDAARFEALVAQARSLRDTDQRRAVELFDEALGLWRGPAFGDLATRDIVRATATRLEEARAAAAADRIDALLVLREHTDVIGELATRVDADPLAERPHGQLMLALYRSGRQAEALATYRALARRLADELGVDPDPGLQRLHERMLQQDPALAAADTPDALPRNRAPDDDLIGRDEDVAAVAALVTSAPLVTLTGPGGVGKTRLADAVVARVDDEFPDGIARCALASVRDPASLPDVVVGALAIPHKGAQSAEEVLLAALGPRRYLLVLDNCEHLLEAVSALADGVRRHCPNVAILATSRQYLRLPDERVWEVTPLVVPLVAATAADVARSPAGALFCARAQAVHPDFALTDDTAPAVADVCRQLDGLPLAIELAARRVRALSPADLADRIGQRFRLLTAGPVKEGGRHRTLRAVVDWSFSLLTDAERRLFTRLSVFAGSFALDAAEQVCADEELTSADVAGVLAELVDKSMVAAERDSGAVRYRLLDTLRAYGAERLEEAGEGARFRHAHARCYVRLVEHLAPALRGADERSAVARIDVEVDNLRAAHAWLADAGDVELALRLPVALHDFIHYRLRDEMVSWTERALELPGASAQASYPAALATAARGALHRGELDRGRRYANDALAQADADSLTSLWALAVLTEVALYEGRTDDAIAFAEQRSALARELGQDYYGALAGISRALACLYGGSPQQAAEHADAARRSAEACGNLTAQAWALYAHGEALLELDPARAVPLLEQAIDAARRIESRLAEGVALVSLASVLGRNDETERALALFRDAVAHWRRLGDHTHQLTTLRNLVELLTRIGADEPAALLHGAVTTGANPSFGAEADRLTAAWAQLEERLGPERAHGLAARGKRLSPTQAADEALAHLDALCTEQMPQQLEKG